MEEDILPAKLVFLFMNYLGDMTWRQQRSFLRLFVSVLQVCALETLSHNQRAMGRGVLRPASHSENKESEMSDTSHFEKRERVRPKSYNSSFPLATRELFGIVRNGSQGY